LTEILPGNSDGDDSPARAAQNIGSRKAWTLESKIAEAKTKKDMYIARARLLKRLKDLMRCYGVNTSGLECLRADGRKVLQLEAQSEAIAEPRRFTKEIRLGI